MKIDAVKFVIDNSPAIARLVSAHGGKPPQLTGDGVTDRDKIGAWMAYIAMLSQGQEQIAHNGATFTARVEAAKELVIEWERLHLTSVDASQPKTALEFRPLIAPAWEDYARHCVPETATLGTPQYDQTRQAFYAGIASLMSMLVQSSADDVPDEVAAHVLATIETELDNYMAERQARAMSIAAQILGRAKR